MPLGATPVSVAAPRCGIWPTVCRGVLVVDRKLFPFRLLRCAHSEMRSESESVSEAYRCGWAEGLFGNTETFVRNDGLARWEDTYDRLAYYRGHRAGRAVRF